LIVSLNILFKIELYNIINNDTSQWVLYVEQQRFTLPKLLISQRTSYLGIVALFDLSFAYCLW